METGDSPPDVCRDCGGRLVEGSMALPLLGSPRFAYRLGTTEVTTEVAALMCLNCGTVQLRARDPERISSAVAARESRSGPSLRLPKVFGRRTGSPVPPPDERHPR
jgi:hypothetical protein